MEQLLLSDSLAQQLIANAMLYRENHTVDNGIINYAHAITDIIERVSFD
jgi:hypothetical protein